MPDTRAPLSAKDPNLTTASTHPDAPGPDPKASAPGPPLPAADRMPEEGTAVPQPEAPRPAPNAAPRPSPDGELPVFRMHERAALPRRASAKAAGYDLTAAAPCVVPAGGRAIVKTGLVVAVPDGTYARIAPRSSLAVKNFVDVGAGVVDGDYRGEVGVVLFNFGDSDFKVEIGDRVAQLILERILTPEIVEVESKDALGETARGDGGYGSTGKRKADAI